MRSHTRWHCALAVLAVIAVPGCSDVEPGARPNAANARRGVDAELVVSDIAPRPGTDFVLLVRLRPGAEVSQVASFTARVAYDTTRLRLLGEEPLDDAASRIVNPAAGDARIAGIATDGFADGQLFAMRFRALAPDGLATLRVAFDELHDVTGSDLEKTVRILPGFVPRSIR